MRLAHVEYNKYISSIFNISLDIFGWEKRMGLGLYSIVIEYKVSKGICLKSILSFRKFQRIKRLRGAFQKKLILSGHVLYSINYFSFTTRYFFIMKLSVSGLSRFKNIYFIYEIAKKTYIFVHMSVKA